MPEFLPIQLPTFPAVGKSSPSIGSLQNNDFAKTLAGKGFQHLAPEWNRPAKRKIMKDNKSLKIFLVDDDSFCLNMYAQQLQNAGFTNVSLFENGTDCLNNLTAEPDVIFLDHSMSPMSGLEVLRKIKRFNPDIYVVFLSAQEAIETAVTSLKYGAFDYIVKGAADAENMTKALQKILQIRNFLHDKKRSLFKKIFSIV